MTYEDIVLNFQGFDPCAFTESQMSAVIRSIYEKSPYGSSLRASFSQEKNVFQGVIKITSSAGSFFATATGPALNDVSQKLFQQIRKHLERWKLNRF